MTMQITDEYNEYIGTIETNEGVFYIVRAGDELIAGGACNVGLMVSDRQEIDPYFSLEENIQEFGETILDKYGY